MTRATPWGFALRVRPAELPKHFARGAGLSPLPGGICRLIFFNHLPLARVTVIKEGPVLLSTQLTRHMHDVREIRQDDFSPFFVGPVQTG